MYWGDIDAAGFEILDGFRADGVPAISMLMDLATFDRYERYGTSLDRRGDRLGPGTRRDLPHLNAAERTMYHALTDPAWQAHRRIEQERIPLTDALTARPLLQLRYLPVERAAGDGDHDRGLRLRAVIDFWQSFDVAWTPSPAAGGGQPCCRTVGHVPDSIVSAQAAVWREPVGLLAEQADRFGAEHVELRRPSA